MARIFLTNKDNIVNGEANYVSLTLENSNTYEKLEPRRLFPVTRPNSYITLLNESQDEVAVIRDIDDLNEESKAAITYSLEDYYLVPKIIKIYSYIHKFGFYKFEVETNRGRKNIDVSTFRDIKTFADNSVRIRDADDNRYIIEDYNKLDQHSKALIFGFI